MSSGEPPDHQPTPVSIAMVAGFLAILAQGGSPVGTVQLGLNLQCQDLRGKDLTGGESVRGEPTRSQPNQVDPCEALPNCNILNSDRADHPGGAVWARVIAPNVGRLNDGVIDRSGDVYRCETGGLHLGCR